MIEVMFEGFPVQALIKCDPKRTGLVASVFLEAKDLLAAVRKVYEADYFLEDVTAIDAKEGYLAVYHFDHWDRPGRIALRVLIPHEAPTLPSIASIYQGAEWHERETMDFYGIIFDGNPNPVPLLLTPGMEGHPLRKEEGARASLADLITPGEILRSVPGFALVPAKEAGSAATGA
jgi:NADH-quinone oxidoreductase subunit C